MKILKKSKNDYTDFEKRRIEANKGCNICPNCGETREFYFEGNNMKGMGRTTIAYHNRWIKSYYTDVYNCFTCGCEWESDPY